MGFSYFGIEFCNMANFCQHFYITMYIVNIVYIVVTLSIYLTVGHEPVYHHLIMSEPFYITMYKVNIVYIVVTLAIYLSIYLTVRDEPVNHFLIMSEPFYISMYKVNIVNIVVTLSNNRSTTLQ